MYLIPELHFRNLNFFKFKAGLFNWCKMLNYAPSPPFTSPWLSLSHCSPPLLSSYHYLPPLQHEEVKVSLGHRQNEGIGAASGRKKLHHKWCNLVQQWEGVHVLQ